MEKSCLYCSKEVHERYRVNEREDLFCDDDCYERYYEESEKGCADINHPYIDQYELIRSNYIDWLENWERDLNEIPFSGNILYRVDEMLDKIDEVFESYKDFYSKEGDDGVFAREIYLYLLKFENLQKSILQWRPRREVLYYLSIEFDHDAFDRVMDCWLTFAKLLYEIRADALFYLLKDNVHPYDNMAFYFETKEELDTVKAELEQTFRDDVISIYDDIAYRCEGECSDIEVIYSSDLGNGELWFFCDSCWEQYYPGFFTLEELNIEIQRCNEIFDTDKAKPYNWHFYIRKIKRSCRYHDIDFPDWIEFDYYF